MTELNISWVKQLGTPKDDMQNALATDPDGNVFICGSTFGSFENREHFGFNEEDAFLAKFDAQGNRLWVRQLGTNVRDTAEGIATDLQGNVFVCGSTYGNLGEKNKGLFTSDYFLAKYNAKGEKIWVKQSGTTFNDFATAIAMDHLGNVIIGGYTYGEMVAGQKKGSWDSFLVKFDGEGNQIWVQQIGTDKTDVLYGIATDHLKKQGPLGDIFVCGYTTGNLPGSDIHGNNDSDAFLAKFNYEGTLIWAKQLGTPENQGAKGIATDPSGNVLICGYNEGAFPGTSSVGLVDLFLAKYDFVGNRLWIKQIGSQGKDLANAISTDQLGNIFVCGFAFGPSGPESSDNSTKAILLQFDPNGNYLAFNPLGSGGMTIGNALSIDLSGNVIISGYTSGALDPSGKAGQRDAFVAKFLSPAVSDRTVTCTIKTSGSTFLNKTNIGIKLWGEEGTTDWMPYSVSLFAEDSFQIDPGQNIGNILACGFEIKEINGAWPSSEVELVSFSIKKDSYHPESVFMVNRVLSKTMGFRLYMTTNGPMPRPMDVEKPEDIDPSLENCNSNKENCFFKAHWMIAHSKKEQEVLKSFLSKAKISVVEWGAAFLSTETETSTLDDAIDSYTVTAENDKAAWDSLKPRLKDLVDSRSFSMNLLDKRMLTFLEDLRIKLIAELELVKGEFPMIINMSKSESESTTSTNEIVSSVFGGLSGVTTLLAAIPFPPLQIGATLFAGLFSIVSVVASSTNPADEDVSSNNFTDAVSASFNRLTLKGANISLNFYHLFLNFEASRRRLKKIALHSTSLLEGFALLEAGLKSGGIQGLPDKYAPRHVGLRPLLKLAYDDLLKSNGFLFGEDLEIINNPSDSQQSNENWYSGITGRLKDDSVGLTRDYSHLTGAKRWTCHQWRLMKVPSNNPSTFSGKAFKRIQWLYPDGRGLLELLKEKRFAQPSLCQVIENETDKGWAYYPFRTSVSFWRPSTVSNWFLYEDFIKPEDKPLLSISAGGATKQIKVGPVFYWWTPNWNTNVYIKFNWVIGTPDDWLVFSWKLDWAANDADPTSKEYN